MRAYLEITNICNRQCDFCPGTHRKKEFVPLERIQHRLEKLHNVDELCLHLMGEPLLHPQFPEVADLCRQRGIPVTLTTNGTLLSPEKQKILLNNPVFRQINFSLQALSADESPLLENILDFCKQALIQRPELYINLRMWNLQNDFSLPERDDSFIRKIFESLHIERPDKLEFHPKWHAFNLTKRIYLHCNTRFEWPVNTSGQQDGKTFCLGLRHQFGILADGSVVPCCLDSEGAIILGNIDTQSLEEILASPRAVAIKNNFRKGIAAEELCKHCSFRKQE